MDHLAKMIPYPAFVDPDDLARRLLITDRLALHPRRSRQSWNIL